MSLELNHLSKEQALELIHLQNSFNKNLFEDWNERNLSWNIAIAQEGSELIDHLGWKWWKKQEPNIEQAKIELVDIFHFWLSLGIETAIREFGADEAQVNEFIVEKLISRELDGWQDMLMESYQHVYGEVNHENWIQFIYYNIKELEKNWSLLEDFTKLNFEIIMVILGMDWQEIYRTYIAKNCLNIFRQNHGYKEGTYIKHWRVENVEGFDELVEDNVFLQSVVDEDPKITFESLYQRLETQYQKQTKEV